MTETTTEATEATETKTQKIARLRKEKAEEAAKEQEAAAASAPKEPKPKKAKAAKAEAPELPLTASFPVGMRGSILATSDDLVIVGLDEYGNDHPLFDITCADAAPSWMVDDVDAVGIKNDIEVCVDPANAAKLLVVSGRTRVKAARAVAKARGKKKNTDPVLVPYRVVPFTDNGADAFMAMVQENALRRVVNWDENVANVSKAKKLGYSVKTIADQLYRGQITEMQVRNWLAYDEKVPAELKTAVLEGRATPTAVLEYVKGGAHKDPDAVVAAFNADLEATDSAGKARSDSKLNAGIAKERNAARERAKEPAAPQTSGISMGELGGLMTKWSLLKDEGKLPEHFEALLDFVKIVKGEASYTRVKGLKAHIEEVRGG